MKESPVNLILIGFSDEKTKRKDFIHPTIDEFFFGTQTGISLPKEKGVQQSKKKRSSTLYNPK